MNLYHPAEQATSSYYKLESNDLELVVRQQPKEALVTQIGKEKNRKPIDPPPFVEIQVTHSADPVRQHLQSPYLFMTCTLIRGTTPSKPAKATLTSQHLLCGQTASSLHKLKDINGEDGGFFIFGDLSARVLGQHHLLFSLFDYRKDTGDVVFLKSVTSEPFEVVQPKQWRGLDESTQLSRMFSDQGVRLRLRKESRSTAGTKRAYPYSPTKQSKAAASTGETGGYEAGTLGDFSQVGAPREKRQRSDEFSQSSMYGGSTSGGGSRFEASMTPSMAPSEFAMPNIVKREQQASSSAYSLQLPWESSYYSPPSTTVGIDSERSSGGPYGLQGFMGASDTDDYYRRPYMGLPQTPPTSHGAPATYVSGASNDPLSATGSRPPQSFYHFGQAGESQQRHKTPTTSALTQPPLTHSQQGSPYQDSPHFQPPSH